MESAPHALGQEGQTGPPPDEFAAPAWQAVSRGVALFLGAFTLLNLAGEMRWSGIDAEFWWIDLRPLPPNVARGFLAWAAILLIWYAARPQIEGGLRTMVIAAVVLLMSGVLWNVYQFYALLRTHELQSAFPLPLALHAAAALVVVFVGVNECPREPQLPMRDAVLGMLACAACAIGFALAQMYCAGLSETRRKSDVIAVFAAEDQVGHSSSAEFADALRTAGELRRAEFATQIMVVMPPADEAALQSIRDLETELELPEADVLLLNVTSPQSAVTETVVRCAELEFNRVLVVAPFYRLPRLRLLFRRQGFVAHTVPVESSAPVQRLPGVLAQEVGELWSYYISSIAR